MILLNEGLYGVSCIFNDINYSYIANRIYSYFTDNNYSLAIRVWGEGLLCQVQEFIVHFNISYNALSEGELSYIHFLRLLDASECQQLKVQVHALQHLQFSPIVNAIGNVVNENYKYHFDVLSQHSRTRSRYSGLCWIHFYTDQVNNSQSETWKNLQHWQNLLNM